MPKSPPWTTVQPPPIFTLSDLEEVPDQTAWELWWNLHKEQYLRLSGVQTGVTTTSTDDFFIGRGEREVGVRGGRATRAVVDSRIRPGLYDLVHSKNDHRVFNPAVISYVRVRSNLARADVDAVLPWALNEEPDLRVARNAALAMGLLGAETHVDALTAIAVRGEFPSDYDVEHDGGGLRAWAAYGLGLAGAETEDVALQRRIVRDLIATLEDEEADEDLQVASMVALGLVPLPILDEGEFCVCCKCRPPEPEASRQAQLTFLLRYLQDERDFGTLLRSHAASTLAVLAAAPDDLALPGGLQDELVRLLVRMLDRESDQPPLVRESAVAALGALADADEEGRDQLARWALKRSLRAGKAMERNLATIALALVGSREGYGREPYAGLNDVRGALLRTLSRGKGGQRSWSALALGVLGHHLRVSGEELDVSVSLALRAHAKRSRKGSERSAAALALGLRADEEAAPMLLKGLAKAKEPQARSYFALALGLAGDRAAIEPLQAALARDKQDPLVVVRSGLALGLLADASVVPTLLEGMKHEDAARRRASAEALSWIGDERSIESLVQTMLDKDEEHEVRSAAAAGLGRLGDPRTSSWRTPLIFGRNHRAQSPSLFDGEGGGVLGLVGW